jgi:hypothetical protein
MFIFKAIIYLYINNVNSKYTYMNRLKHYLLPKCKFIAFCKVISIVGCYF